MILLCILDGFGLREPTPDNAVANADKPVYDSLALKYPFTKIDGSGPAVGLPDGQMGNSEVGHLNLGAGRIVFQDISRIDKSISSGEFNNNLTLVKALEEAASSGKAVHLFGLLSDGKVHSSLDHLYALVTLAKEKNIKKLYLHAFMDGRDTSPRGGIKYMTEVLSKLKEIGLGQVATVGGRYYAMDRDQRWERIEKAYQAIVYGIGPKFANPLEVIQASYDDDISDEFIIPAVIEENSEKDKLLKNGDIALFYNFRADRVRQLAAIFCNLVPDEIKHSDNPKINLVTMTHYHDRLREAKVVFPPKKLDKILGEVISNSNLKQYRTAETEKYAHVTYFFNGRIERPFKNEDRGLIQSPKVATYDLQPEMSSVELTDNVIEQINSEKYDFILINYANCDMVGHTGDFDATKKAVEAVDRGLGRLLEAVKSQKGIAIVTADHGNAEQMINSETGETHTAHTTNLVPCILFDPSKSLPEIKLRDGGILADIAPTVLDLLGIEKPDEMSGVSLLIK